MLTIEDIKQEIHAESPESLIEVVGYLSKLGYKIWRFRHKDGNFYDHAEVMFSEEELQSNIKNNKRIMWTASLKMVSRCKFCNSLVQEKVDNGSKCSKCKKTLYLLFPEGSQIQFSIEEDKRFMHYLSLRVQERHQDRTDYFLKLEDCPIPTLMEGSMYHDELKNSYKTLKEEIKSFPNVLKISKKDKIEVVSVDDKDVTFVNSVGEEDNIKRFHVFDGKEFEEYRSKLPVPGFIQIFEQWKNQDKLS